MDLNIRPIKGLLFDKDGTLFDFRASWAKWLSAVLYKLAGGDAELARNAGAMLGYNTQKCEFESEAVFVAGTPDDTLRILTCQFPEWPIKELLHIVGESAAMAEQVPAAPLRPLLSKLRQEGYRLGVVTNDWEHVARAHLNAADCCDLFDYVAGSDSGYGAKPDPGMLTAFCDQFQIPPNQCLMIGDSPSDMEAGRKAGMTAIGVLTGMDSRETLASIADEVLQDIGRLPDWLANPCA